VGGGGGGGGVFWALGLGGWVGGGGLGWWVLVGGLGGGGGGGVFGWGGGGVPARGSNIAVLFFCRNRDRLVTFVSLRYYSACERFSGMFLFPSTATGCSSLSSFPVSTSAPPFTSFG